MPTLKVCEFLSVSVLGSGRCQHRVSRQAIVTAAPLDPRDRFSALSYRNSRTGVSALALPAFMRGRLDWYKAPKVVAKKAKAKEKASHRRTPPAVARASPALKATATRGIGTARVATARATRSAGAAPSRACPAAIAPRSSNRRRRNIRRSMGRWWNNTSAISRTRRRTSESKHQIPRSKNQRRSKSLTGKGSCLGLGVSLVFGSWCLELPHQSPWISFTRKHAVCWPLVKSSSLGTVALQASVT